MNPEVAPEKSIVQQENAEKQAQPEIQTQSGKQVSPKNKINNKKRKHYDNYSNRSSPDSFNGKRFKPNFI